MKAQDFPQETPLYLPTASLPQQPLIVDLRAVLEHLQHEYRVAVDCGHTLRAVAYREVLHVLRLQIKKASVRQSDMSNFDPSEE